MGGKFNLGLGKSGSGAGFNLGGTRRDIADSTTTTQRDVIYGIAKDILTRENWTPEEKSMRLENLNGALLQGDFFNPDTLPNKFDMMNAGNLDREQTPFSGKYQTKGEREYNQEKFNRHPENQPALFRPKNLPNDDT